MPDWSTVCAEFQRGEVSSTGALLVWTHAFHVAYAVLHNQPDAADAASDTYVIVMREASTVRECSSFKGWVGKIARREAWRRGGAGPAFPPEMEVPGDDPPGGFDPPAAPDSAETRAAWLRAEVYVATGQWLTLKQASTRRAVLCTLCREDFELDSAAPRGLGMPGSALRDSHRKQLRYLYERICARLGRVLGGHAAMPHWPNVSQDKVRVLELRLLLFTMTAEDFEDLLPRGRSFEVNGVLRVESTGQEFNVRTANLISKRGLGVIPRDPTATEELLAIRESSRVTLAVTLNPAVVDIAGTVKRRGPVTVYAGSIRKLFQGIGIELDENSAELGAE